MSTNVLASSTYEITIIIKPTLSEKSLTALIEQIESAVTKLDGEILKREEPISRRLGYKINGHREAYVLTFQFKAPTSAPASLKRTLSIMEDVSRHVIIKKELI